MKRIKHSFGIFHKCCYTLNAMKNWLKRLLAGIGIGVGSAIPGVSGGTIAVILHVYESFIWSISHLFKEFKKAFFILLPIVIGIVIGLVPTIILMDKALEGFIFGVVCVFAGFIVGSLPKITGEVKGKPYKPVYTVVLIVSLLITVGLGVGSVISKNDVSAHFANPEPWFYVVLIPVGLLASTALVIPGVSGGMMLILLGFYAPLITSTVDTAKACLAGDWSNFGTQIALLACFFVGVAIGFFLISKLMNYLLDKYHDITFYGILGFVIGSIIALFINYEIWNYYQLWASGGQGFLKKEIEIPLGIALFIIAMVLSYLLVRYENKHANQETEEN